MIKLRRIGIQIGILSGLLITAMILIPGCSVTKTGANTRTSETVHGNNNNNIRIGETIIHGKSFSEQDERLPEKINELFTEFLFKKKEMGLFVDDQQKLNSEIKKVVNPTPIERDFVGNNAKHRILIAHIDNGVDYNHKELLNNMHFQLDGSGRPVRLGYDFVGNDNWPAPYLGRLYPENDQYELLIIEWLTKNNLRLKNKYLDTRRALLQEYLSMASHGTKVSASILKNRSDIGLLPYRYGAVGYKNGLNSYRYYTMCMENINKSVAMAIKDGANIVVISSKIFAQIPDDAVSDARDLKRFLYWKKLNRDFEDLVASAPNMLFLVCLGNDNGQLIKRDNDNLVNFMSGIVADNLLRIGSVNSRGEIADFSNVAVDELSAVYLPGENIPTTTPTNMLVPPANYAANFYSIMNDIAMGNDNYESIGRVLLIMADNPRQFCKESGTSMSVGIGGNIAAGIRVDNKDFTPLDIIGEMKRKINTGQLVGATQGIRVAAK